MQLVEVNQIINNEPELEQQEVIRENCIKYPKSLFGQFEFDLYDSSLKPDCTFILNNRKNYVYFNLRDLYYILKEKIDCLFKRFPKNLENLKAPIEKYMKEYQKEEYKENLSTIGYILERTKFFFCEESYDRKVQERLIKMAFLYSQLNSEEIGINNLINTRNIGIIDSFNYKIKKYNYEDFQNIIDEINNIDVRINNINEIDTS